MSYQFYKILHFSGIALILLGLGIALGAFATSKSVHGKLRMVAFLSHGLGMVIALTGGFGMAARLGLVTGFPGWIYGKLVIWVLLGLGVSLAKRKSSWALSLTLLFTALVAVATGLAVYKPSMAPAPVEQARPPGSLTQ